MHAFKQLAGLISEVIKAKKFIDEVYVDKRNGLPINRTGAQLKEIVNSLRDNTGDMLGSLTVNNMGYVD